MCPDNKSVTLLSIRNLCNVNYLAAVNKDKIVTYKNKEIMRVIRFLTTGINIADITNLKLEEYLFLHANLQKFTSLKRTRFLHSTIGYSITLSLIRVIKSEYLLSFPQLTIKNVSKLHAPNAIVFRCMDQRQKNIQSTEPK